MKRILWGVLFLLALVGASAWNAPALAANLLVNPGFEDGGGSYNGWFTFGSGVQLSLPAGDNIIRTGAAAAKTYGEFTGCPDFPQFDVGGFGQAFDFPLAGTAYELSGWSFLSSGDPIPGTDQCTSNRLIAKIVFFDTPGSGGAEISSNEIILGGIDTPLDQWNAFSVSAPVPPGAARVEALFLFLQPACDTGAVYVDDTSFQVSPVVPETNLLANPSFDAGLAGWTPFENVFAEGRSFAVRTTPGSAKLFGPFGDPGAASGMYQSFPTSPGTEFRMSAWVMTTCVESPLTGTNDNYATLKIVFLDGGGTELAFAEEVILDNTAPLGTWTKHSVVAQAPVGTVTVNAYVLFVQPTNMGGAVWVDDVVFRAEAITDAPVVQGSPGFELYQNAPNPFRPATRIDFVLDRRSPVDLTVYDVAGRRVATLLRGALDSGPHQVTWDGTTAAGRAAAPGIYRYVLKTPAGQASRSMVLLK